jgi:hypothetical protein
MKEQPRQVFIAHDPQLQTKAVGSEDIHWLTPKGGQFSIL